MASKSYRLKIQRTENIDWRKKISGTINFCRWGESVCASHGWHTANMYVSSSVRTEKKKEKENSGWTTILITIVWFSLDQSAIGQRSYDCAPHRLIIQPNHSRSKLMSNCNSTELPHEFRSTPRRLCESNKFIGWGKNNKHHQTSANTIHGICFSAFSIHTSVFQNRFFFCLHLFVLYSFHFNRKQIGLMVFVLCSFTLNSI